MVAFLQAFYERAGDDFATLMTDIEIKRTVGRSTLRLGQIGPQLFPEW